MLSDMAMSAIDTIREVSFPELNAIKYSLVEEKEEKSKETGKDEIKFFGSTHSLDLLSTTSSSNCFADIAFYISECHKQLLEIPPEA
jgi:hypothetical protein